MAEQVTVKVWVMVDENGDACVCLDGEDIGDAYATAVGGDASVARRLVCLTVNVPRPEPVEVMVDVPAESGAVKVKVS